MYPECYTCKYNCFDLCIKDQIHIQIEGVCTDWECSNYADYYSYYDGNWDLGDEKYFKIVQIVKGEKRSLYHEHLHMHNMSLIYSTDKPTPPLQICFVFNDITACLKFANMKHTSEKGTVKMEIWECKGDFVGEFTKIKPIFIKDIGLTIHSKSVFMTNVILTNNIKDSYFNMSF